jgi:1-acyl-sn-glycerol-3-phosphate acyltransferase
MTTLFNVFPLPRSSGFRRSFAHAGEALDRGYSVLIFPEGHRSEDGQIHPFRQGIGLLAQQSQVPILPVAHKGLGELKRERSGWFRSGKLTILVGKAISVDAGEQPADLTRKFEESLKRLDASTQTEVWSLQLRFIEFIEIRQFVEPFVKYTFEVKVFWELERRQSIVVRLNLEITGTARLVASHNVRSSAKNFSWRAELFGSKACDIRSRQQKEKPSRRN